MSSVYSLTPRMRFISLLCIGLLCALNFLLGLQIGARIAETPSASVDQSARGKDAPVNGEIQTRPMQSGTEDAGRPTSAKHGCIENPQGRET